MQTKSSGTVKLEIWDTGNHYCHHCLLYVQPERTVWDRKSDFSQNLCFRQQAMYYKEAKAVLIVYDMSDEV